MNTSPSTLIRRVAVGVIAVGASGALLASAPAADAASRANVTVTIKAEGTDLSGTVVSNRDACMDQRKVVVWKQVGKRGGGDDVKFASDVTEIVNGVGQWSTGNTGTEGKFYATVKRSPLCKADSSPTIKAVRND